MASTSILFRNKSNDDAYADTLIYHAKDFAKSTPFALYQDSIPAAKEFYASSSYNDELVSGALWLHRATNDYSYLLKPGNYFNILSLSKQTKILVWDEKLGAVYVLVYNNNQDSMQAPLGKQRLNTTKMDLYDRLLVDLSLLLEACCSAKEKVTTRL
ncbi:5624_t:CDS:1 [Ambispora gerdemannii]|uniref:cellulase n=1 Tax=Ambispora gerdemannii TaxID=144530 RepID=A0A9N9F948_9GLOM|nr:5624_t:CDS:1 [Ambispora gerdemannii]